MEKQEKFKALTEPFPASDIEWRVGSSSSGGGSTWAKLLAYVTNWAVMDRLDAVFGPDNWKNEFFPTKIGDKDGVICHLSVRFHADGEWLTKMDGADCTDVESYKGALSDSMKRAAVHFGIGRYLYDLGESWATDIEKGPAKVRGSKRYYSKFKDGEWYSYNAPSLPRWALPAGDKSEPIQGTIPPPPDAAEEPPKAKDPPPKGDARVNAAKAKIALTGNAKDLEKISKYADEILKKGEITQGQRDEIGKAITDAAARIKAVVESPHNPGNKE